jgi:hypothetical protein
MPEPSVCKPKAWGQSGMLGSHNIRLNCRLPYRCGLPALPSFLNNGDKMPETTLKNESEGPWRSPDGTIYPLGKPKGKAKLVKLYVPQWELIDVQTAMQKMGYDSLGPYFKECELRMRRINRIQESARKRLREEMLSYGLTPRDLGEG